MQCSKLDDITAQLITNYITEQGKYRISAIGPILLEVLEENGPMDKNTFVTVLLEKRPALKYAWRVSYQRLLEQGMIKEENDTVEITPFGLQALKDCRDLIPAARKAKETDSLLSIL